MTCFRAVSWIADWESLGGAAWATHAGDRAAWLGLAYPAGDVALTMAAELDGDPGKRRAVLTVLCEREGRRIPQAAGAYE
jgi:hypothetical protein